MKIIIQCQYSQLEQYSDLLDQEEKIGIEVTDFAYPQNYGLQGEKLLEKWKSHQYYSRIEGIHGSYFDLVLHSIDPQIAQITRKRYLWNLGIADQLEAKYTIFHTNYQTEHSSKQYIKNWVQSHLDFVERYNEVYQCEILLENLRDPSPLLLSSLIKVADIEVSTCLDIGHLQAYSVDNFSRWFVELGDSIQLIHLKDTIKPGDELQLGTGRIKWDEVADLIRGMKNTPDIVLEIEGIDQIMSSINFLRDLGIIR